MTITFKKYVLTYTRTDGCTYWAAVVLPFESMIEDETELNVAFMEAAEKAEGSFTFYGMEFDKCDFINPYEHKYEMPEICSLYEWFERNKPHLK